MLSALGTEDGIRQAVRIWHEAAAAAIDAEDRVRAGLAYRQLGVAHSLLGESDSALEFFAESWTRLPTGEHRARAETAYTWGLALQGLGRHEEAISRFEDAARLTSGRDWIATGHARLAVGDSRLALGEFHEATHDYSSAAVIFGTAGFRVGEAWATFRHGLSLQAWAEASRQRRHPHHGMAAHYYEEALRLLRGTTERGGTAAVLLQLGSLLGGVFEEQDTALRHLQEALALAREVGDTPLEGRVLIWLGRTYHALGHNLEALDHSAAALTLLRGGGDPHLEALAAHALASVAWQVGRFGVAFEHAEHALALQRGGPDPSGEAQTLALLGWFHTDLGRFDLAIDLYREALAVQRRLPEESADASINRSLGWAHFAAGELETALGHFEVAREIAEARRDTRAEAWGLYDISAVNARRERPDSALLYLSSALELFREAEDRAGEGAALEGIGFLEMELGHRGTALAHLRAALQIQRNLHSRPGEKGVLANIAAWHLMADPPDRHVALAYFDSAGAVQAGIARDAHDDEIRLSVGDVDASFFDRWALTWLDLAVEIGGRQAGLAALGAAERGRAQAMLDLVRDERVGRADGVAAPAEDLASEAERLVTTVTDAGAAALSYLVTGDTIVVWLALPDGDVSVHRQVIAGDSLQGAIALLRHGLRAEAADARLAEAEPDEDAMLNPVLEAWCARGCPDALRMLSRWLFPAVIASRLPPDGEIIIVPHGALGLVPFAALPVGGQPLGLRYALRYAPSLAILAELKGRPPPGDSWPRTALVIGNPAMPVVPTSTGPRRLSALRYARAEADLIERLLLARVPDVELLTLNGAGATLTAARDLLQTASLVHLATHGFAYGSEALSRHSFVALAPSAEHDGLLTVGQIIDELEFDAELIVLSACQTGLGHRRKAEGTVGLQRALLAKGARSVLVSLWNVDDQATAHFMHFFYEALLGDDRPSPAEALRAAQWRMVTDTDYQNPRYWAAFQLVGAG